MTVTDEGPADPEHEADNQDVSRGEMRELKNMIDKCAVNLMVNMLSSTEYDVDLSIARTA